MTAGVRPGYRTFIHFDCARAAIKIPLISFLIRVIRVNSRLMPYQRPTLTHPLRPERLPREKPRPLASASAADPVRAGRTFKDLSALRNFVWRGR